MDEKTRIEEVIKYADMNARQFAATIDLNPSTLSHVLSGRNNPSLDIMQKILKNFPNINPGWLILGEGSMYRRKNDSQMLSLFELEEQNDLKTTHYTEKTEEKISDPFNSLQKKTEENIILPQNSSANKIRQAEENTQTPSAPQNASKTITKIIVYFSDNTFQELK